jgi:tRNA(fMet)-specific endonuclease VapC
MRRMITDEAEAGYIFDTDTVSELFNGNEQIASRLNSVPAGSVSISVVTVVETFQGWLAVIQRSQAKGKPAISEAYDGLIRAQTNIASFITVRYSEEAEAIFQAFPPSVKRVGRNDCRIAATAIANGLIVVTRNTRDFEKIPNVKFEDWTAR